MAKVLPEKAKLVSATLLYHLMVVSISELATERLGTGNPAQTVASDDAGAGGKPLTCNTTWVPRLLQPLTVWRTKKSASPTEPMLNDGKYELPVPPGAGVVMSELVYQTTLIPEAVKETESPTQVVLSNAIGAVGVALMVTVTTLGALWQVSLVTVT